MSPYLESLVVTPAILARNGCSQPVKAIRTYPKTNKQANPIITQAALEYAAIYRNGKPPAGTLKQIAMKYGLASSSVAAKFMRMSCR